ncbi:pyrroline-5-carboxylate reductase 3-like [Brevipalpus obovatus]|uniref:pyrroline-5-carboxylate reductase 3-like n=1 Tax=Brevipalpus obovatus TaxID=246614 RepID=UPI003D9F0576
MTDKLVFFGLDGVAVAIIKGFIKHGGLSASDIFICSKEGIPSDLRPLGCTNLTCNDLSDKSQLESFSKATSVIAFICVKPEQFADVVKPVCAWLKYSRGCIASVVPGITMQSIKTAFSSLRSFKIIRTIANLAVECGQGVWAWTANNRSDCSAFQKLIERISFAPYVEERDLDTVGALSGSGIALVISFMEAMRSSAVFNGMNANLARRIISKTLIGGATLVESNKVHPNQIIDELSTPGGATAHGLHRMQKANVSISSAMNDTVKKIKELSSMVSQEGDQFIVSPPSDPRLQTSVVLVKENGSSQDGQFEISSIPIQIGSPSNTVSKRDKRDRYYFRQWQLEVLEVEFQRCSHPDTDAREAIVERLNKEFERMKGRPLEEKERVTNSIVHTWFANKRTKRIKRSHQSASNCDFITGNSNQDFSLDTVDSISLDARNRFSVKREPDEL